MLNFFYKIRIKTDQLLLCTTFFIRSYKIQHFIKMKNATAQLIHARGSVLPRHRQDNFQAVALMISMKSAFKLHPPTRKPSMFGLEIKEAAFAGLTDPP